MRLSEAIRSGALLRPQAFGAWFPPDPLYGYKSCALGAALEAAGFDAAGMASGSLPEDGRHVAQRRFVESWPFSCLVHTACPSCCPCPPKLNLDELIMHLNDCHEWSRERIANWLETSGLNLEPAGEKEAAAEPVTEVAEPAEPVEEPVCV